MNQAIGILHLNLNNNALQEITENRPLAAVPFGGRYRLVDFSLSSMVNAGISKVGIVTPYHYRPILDHLGAGKEWSLDRKTEGLFIMPGGNLGLRRQWHFPLRDVIRSVEFLTKSTKTDIVFSEANFVANIDVSEVLDYHRRNDYDVTLVYKRQPPEIGDLHSFSRLELQGVNDVTDFWQSSSEKEKMARENPPVYYIGVGVIKRQLLHSIVTTSPFAVNMDLFDILHDNLYKLKVGGYEHRGFFGKISSVPCYYQANMALLDSRVRQELFTSENPIHTRIKDNPPTHYHYKALVSNSLVSSGCLIDGTVDGSILFREVQVEESAELRNCIVLNEGHIGKNAKLEHVILDKYVRVSDNVVLKGKPEEPLIIGKYSSI